MAVTAQEGGGREGGVGRERGARLLLWLAGLAAGGMLARWPPLGPSLADLLEGPELSVIFEPADAADDWSLLDNVVAAIGALTERPQARAWALPCTIAKTRPMPAGRRDLLDQMRGIGGRGRRGREFRQHSGRLNAVRKSAGEDGIVQVRRFFADRT